MAKGEKLTIKQKKFCLEYIKIGFCGQAYINAGYSATTKAIAEANGRKLLAKQLVKDEISRLMEKVENDRIAEAKEVLEFLTQSMRGEIQEQVVVVENSGDYTSEARIIHKQIGLKDRIKSAELLGKRYKIFTEKVEIEGSQQVQIVDDIE